MFCFFFNYTKLVDEPVAGQDLAHVPEGGHTLDLVRDQGLTVRVLEDGPIRIPDLAQDRGKFMLM